MNEKRDWKIYFEWIEGKDYNELAAEFGLSHGRIKEICIAKVPQNIRNMVWQRANQYKKYREWIKNQKRQGV